ncbi:MAG: carotenoid 1,2-hydratase [Pseudomonadota bacterium]
MFSPYYAWSGRKNPNDHVALNVGLYGRGVKRWTMTERGEGSLSQQPDYLQIGPSSLSWDGENLVIEIDEWANPIPRKVKGVITISTQALTDKVFQLDGNGRHFWHPLAPKASVKVQFENPTLDWSGKAYIDSNWGSESLEEGFENWDWSRAHLSDGTGILYDAFTRDGDNRQLALKIEEDGSVREIEIDPRRELKKGPIWRVHRSTLCSQSGKPKTLKMLEDTPFYTRSYVSTLFENEETIAVHESLDCNRFASNWVRCLLPFRMPRITQKSYQKARQS